MWQILKNSMWHIYSPKKKEIRATPKKNCTKRLTGDHPFSTHIERGAHQEVRSFSFPQNFTYVLNRWSPLRIFQSEWNMAEKKKKKNSAQ